MLQKRKKDYYNFKFTNNFLQVKIQINVNSLKTKQEVFETQKSNWEKMATLIMVSRRSDMRTH